MSDLQALQDTVWEYYRLNAREMPWRNDPSPYNVVVSEIMLQQTQVSRVTPKYLHFMALFPDWYALAGATSSQVLAAWQGLGYNRRALNLHATAKIVAEQHRGILPDDPQVLQTLPGIGPNTAGSIVAFAYDVPVVFIETNIRRVFIFHLFPEVESVTDKQLMPHIKTALDTEHPRQWYYALMDYGSYLAKLVPNPNRQSSHYARQSKFEGSHRQVRGAVVRLLLQHRDLSLQQLAEMTETAPLKLLAALEQLIAEGFIQPADSTPTLYRLLD